MLRTFGRRFTIWLDTDGSIEPDPLPFLLKMIPNTGSSSTSVEFHLILQIVVFMAHPHCPLDALGAWTQVLTPLCCRLTISIWSHYEFRIPELLSMFESQFSEMRAQRRSMVVNMGSYSADKDWYHQEVCLFKDGMLFLGLRWLGVWKMQLRCFSHGYFLSLPYMFFFEKCAEWWEKLKGFGKMRGEFFFPWPHA